MSDPDDSIQESRPRPALEKQDSVDVSSLLSSHSAFTEDSLDTDSVRQRSETSGDSETDQAAVTIRLQSSQLTSPSSNTSSLERERQEDLEVFGLHADMFSYEAEQEEPEFFFDSSLDLEAGVEDNIVAAELLRPERLDTVEEVSEPHSESLQSLPHDGVRWPEQQSQHTSLGTCTDILNSLNSVQDTDNDKEEMFSQAEMEFRNSFRSLDRANVLKSQSSDDKTLSQLESIGLQPEELTYERNPFEIFHKKSSSSQQSAETVVETVKTVTVTQSTLSEPVLLPVQTAEVTTRPNDSKQRIAHQLEEVRKGIFKLLSESDDDVDHLKSELGVTPLSGEEEYQADLEDEMGCVSAEREDRGTDSGIERGQGSSRAASAESWLARLTSRMGRQSSNNSQASTPDTGLRRRAGSLPHSPRDGGFAEAGLEMRVRELWLRLAQMETEKLRAVEMAVEEERKRSTEILIKERLGLDREKREMSSEREKLAREREALEQQVSRFTESQAREADLVNKLQAKLVKYKTETLEGGSLIQQLSAQTRQDTALIREQADRIDELQQQLQTQKVLHASEIQELQIRIEEGGEKLKTLQTLSDSVRQELELSRETVHGLEGQLVSTRQELDLSRQEVELLSKEGGVASQGVAELLELSRSVASVRRQYQEMRHETVKEMNKLKVDLAERARQVSTACLEVYSSSQYIKDSQGNTVLVGNIKECWEKLERVRLEKKVEEERGDQLEVEKDQLVRELRVVERKFEDMKLTVEELRKQRGESRDEPDERTPSRLGQLEAENEMLRCSLADIASMVESEEAPQSPGRPRPLVPGSRSQRPSSRRSRSSDSGLVTAAVQASLNSKQAQVYQLQTKVSSLQNKVVEEAKSGAEWQNQAKELTRELAVKTAALVSAEQETSVARDMAEMLQSRLDKNSQELRTASDELSGAKEEIMNLNRKMEENKKLKEILENKMEEIKQKLADRERDRKENSESLNSKENIIKQLNVEKTNLTEEISSLKERLMSVEKDQERLEMERTDKETTISLEKKIRNETTIEVRKLKKQETFLLEQIAQKETFEKKIREDMLANESIIQSLKTEIMNYEKNLSDKDIEVAHLTSVVAEKEKMKDVSESSVKQLKRDKNDLANQVTSISLRKDALEDEYFHVREEYKDLKEQMELLQKTYTATSGFNDELRDKLSQSQRQCKELEVRVKGLVTELDREMVESEDWRLECEGLEQRNKELEEENQKKGESVKQLNQSIVTLKSKLLEAGRQLSEFHEKTETENEIEKRKIEKNLKKLKEEHNNSLKDIEDEMELMKQKLDRKRLTDINNIKDDFKSEKERLQEEIDYLTQQVDNLKARSNESFVIAENSRTTAEKLARTEETLAEEKIIQLNSSIEQLKKDLLNERKEHQKILSQEGDSKRNLEVQIQSLKRKQEENDFSNKKEVYEKEIRKLKNDKLRMDQELSDLKMQSKISENITEDLKAKIDNLKDEKQKIEMETINNKTVISNLEAQITEKNQKIQEKILEKHNEVEVLEKRIESYEKSEKLLQEEFEELRETFEKSQLESSSSSQVQTLQSKISELNLELELTRNRLSENDGGREREERTLSDLRRKLHSAAFEKSKLENSLAELREQVELDGEVTEAATKALQASLLESRERERKLEDLRHHLELELNMKSQEMRELMMKVQSGEKQRAELSETAGRLEQSRAALEAKLTGLSSELGGLSVSSRAGTPVRGRVRMRSGEALDVDTVRGKVRDLLGRLERAEKEKDELHGRLEMLKLANENLVLNTGRLEEEKESAEDKLRNCQLQLQKVETKVSFSDQSLAEKEEIVEKLKVQVREADRKVKDLSNHLDDSNQRRLDLEEMEKKLRSEERRAKLDSSRLGGSLRDVEEELEKVRREKMMLGEEVSSLHSILRDREEAIQVGQNRVASLSSDCEDLERQLSQLSSQLARAEGDLGRSSRTEQELRSSVEQLRSQLEDRADVDGLMRDQNSSLQRQVLELEQERRLLEERLENSKAVSKDAKKEVKEAEDSMLEVSRRLNEAERGRQEAEQRLAQAGCNVGADNYLKEELNKTRKENIGLSEKVKELERRVKQIKTERVERSEVVNSSYSGKMMSENSERIVRSQMIPLLSGRGGTGPEQGEHLVRIKILEQEVERHLRRVDSLNQQLSELEAQHRTRVEEMLQERKAEREKDHTRHASSLKQLEHSLNSRERMYKERISGLEEQVHILRNQLTKEARSRRTFINSSHLLSNDVSELRRQLDISLDIVQNSSKAGLESGILDREASRLARLTPSKRPASPSEGRLLRSSSWDTLARERIPTTSTPVRKSQEPSLRSPLVPASVPRREIGSGLRRSLTTEFDQISDLNATT